MLHAVEDVVMSVSFKHYTVLFNFQCRTVENRKAKQKVIIMQWSSSSQEQL